MNVEQYDAAYQQVGFNGKVDLFKRLFTEADAMTQTYWLVAAYVVTADSVLSAPEIRA